MAITDRPRFLLPAEAYTSPDWFEQEQRRVIDTTWHRGSGATVVEHWDGLDFCSERPAEPLTTALGDLPSSIGSVRPGLLTEVARVDLDGRFNWKLFIENHIDVLHLWYLHDVTLGDYDHARFDHRQLGRNWVSYEPLRPGVTGLATSSRAGTPTTPAGGTTTAISPISHLDERDRTGLGAHLVFPDTPIAVSSEFFLTYRARPVTPDRTVIELRLLAEPGTDPDPLVASVRSFVEEDMAACERIQAAVYSRHFEVGPIAVTHEAPVMAFQRNLLDLMEGPPL